MTTFQLAATEAPAATLPAYTWDKTDRKFRGENGRFVSREKVRGAMDAYVDSITEDIRAVATRLVNREIGIEEFHSAMEILIKHGQTSAGAIAAGGWKQARPADWAIVGRKTKFQYGHLRQFARDLEDGLPLDGSVVSQAAMYGVAATGTYEAVLRRGDIAAGFDREQRHTHSSNSCDPCAAYAARGWQPAGLLPGIGEQCDCRSNCRCTFERERTRSAKVKKGPKPKPAVIPKPTPTQAPTPAPRPADPGVAGRTSDPTMEGALATARSLGVNIVPGSPEPVTLGLLNAVNREVAKMPRAVLDAIERAGKRLDVLAGRGITDHPDHAHLKGVTPRGWPEGTTWDTIPGASSGTRGATVIVANKMEAGHGSVNLVLHEHAHTWDSATRVLNGTSISDSTEWRSVWEKSSWPTAYQKTYPEEGLVESFAGYFDSPSARAALPPDVRDFWARKEAAWSRPAR